MSHYCSTSVLNMGPGVDCPHCGRRPITPDDEYDGSFCTECETCHYCTDVERLGCDACLATEWSEEGRVPA